MTTPTIEIAIERSYFFDRGLHFECLRCGACCTGAPGTIYVGPEEIGTIAGHLELSREEFIRLFLYPFRDSFSIREDQQGNCLFYRDGCRIYPVRPNQCRTWPFWLSNLRSEKAWREAGRRCPGIGRGRLIPARRIMACVQSSMQL